MRHIPHIFFSENIFPEQEDDIDKLFRNLEQVEPPPSVIERILSSVSQLPPPVASISPGVVPPPTVQELSVISETLDVLNEVSSDTPVNGEAEDNSWYLLDGLVVRKEWCEPS